ncbi:peptidase C1 [Klebsiella variicola]|nr:peptidase C1 [Klebsiella variicola]
MVKLLLQGSSGPEVVELRKRLAKTLGADAKMFALPSNSDTFDATLASAVRHWQSNIGIIADGVVGPYCQSLLALIKLPAFALRADEVQHLFPATKPSNVLRYLPYVAAALTSEGLTTIPLILVALGTIRAETEGFVPISEYPSQFNTLPGLPAFSAYDVGTDKGKNLGNINPGDGARFRGRGFVQLTGRSNYQKYASRIGVDIIGSPDLANAPEVAAVLLAMFLGDRREALTSALTATPPDYRKARRLVNGGAHGLDSFKKVFTLAAVLPAVMQQTSQIQGAGAGRGSRQQAGAAAIAAPAEGPVLNASKDPLDLRDRTYTPPPVSLPDRFPVDKDIATLLTVYTQAQLILDQGREGACTGFGLACVVNYLRWRKAGFPKKLDSVSPRMLYNFARRYDEYAGEDYDGSSCRGALKGWFHHGVCLESDWPYREQENIPPQYGYAERAVNTTLGVYYRIDIKNITDMQAAIHDVGAIYVSAFTHEGWQTVPTAKKAPTNHDSLAVIAFNGKPTKTGGHAFALVGFNRDGFIVQNSWGTEWGCGGFAVLSYADWLTNAMDAWVAALGVPGVVPGQLATGSPALAAPAAAGNHPQWWDETTAYQHSIVIGNDGRVDRYLTQDEMTRTLMYQGCVLPDRWFRLQHAETKRLVIYAHGGLNNEAGSIARARAMGRYFTGNDCYPLFLVWKTGILESIGDIFSDHFRREPSRAGGVREALTEASDLLIEETIGRPAAKPLWSEMKENAEFSCVSGRAGDLLVTALQKLVETWGKALEIHIIGHSAGSIILGHFVDLLSSRGLGDALKSAHLYAPACTVQFANRHYAPHELLMKRMYLHILSDRIERADNVAAIYRKSLLYFVSNALEGDRRTPLLGMDKIHDKNYSGWDGSSSTGEALRNWRHAAAEAGLEKRGRTNIIDIDKVRGGPGVMIDASHGSFDNNIDVISLTLQRIVENNQLNVPVDDLRGF